MANKFNRIEGVIEVIHETFWFSPGNFYVQSKEGVILYSNKSMCNSVGYDSFDELSEKPLDFVLGLNKDEINDVRRNDLLAIHQEKTIRCVEKVTPEKLKQPLTFMSEKKPFYHRGEIVGVWGTSIPLSVTGHVSSLSDVSFYHPKTKQPFRLTPQQSRCLLLLNEGKSVKQVAILMNLSIKTIQNYIYEIRENNNISSLQDLSKLTILY